MGRGGGSCNSKDDAVADSDAKPQPRLAGQSNAVAPEVVPAQPLQPTPLQQQLLPPGDAAAGRDNHTLYPSIIIVDTMPTAHTRDATVSTSILSPSQVSLDTRTPSAATLSPTSQHSAELAAYLGKVPLLSKLSTTERDQLVSALHERRFNGGDPIVREGEEGDEFYLIREGQVRVTKQSQPNSAPTELAILRPSDYFGEQALVNNSRRMATITAITPVVCLTMSRERFNALFGSERLGISFVKRAAVSAESYGDGKPKEEREAGRGGGQAPKGAQLEKDDTQRQMLLSVVTQNILFAQLTPDQRAAVVDTMWLQPVSAQSTIIKQGDPGDFFYVVDRGIFDIYVKPKPSSSPTHTHATPPTTAAVPVKVAERKAAESFGELALLYNAPRAATVVAREDSAVWVLSRFTFRKIVTAGNAAKLREYEAFLKKVTSFEALLDYERAKIAEALEEVQYPAGSVIVRQGEAGDTFFIIANGEVRCTIKGEGLEEVEVARYTTGNYFGERALVNNEKRAATVTAVTSVTCLYLNRDAFATLLGPFEEIFKRREVQYRSASQTPKSTPMTGARSILPAIVNKNATTTSTGSSPALTTVAPSSSVAPLTHASSSLATTSSFSSSASSTAAANSSSSLPAKPPVAVRYNLSEFKVIGTLGKGSFGHVQLVRHYLTNTTYALKTVSKMSVVRLGQQEHMVNERRSMMALQHPFLIRLYATFQDKNCIYLLLEVSLGGELFSLLRSRTLFDEPTARFYAAGVVVAFEYMHARGYIYRDLKVSDTSRWHYRQRKTSLNAAHRLLSLYVLCCYVLQPENLLLDAKGYLKITDFGFAKQVGDGRTWTLCGTPDYLAPEVVSGQGHGKGVDWWTLGILIYEMLASYPPFYDEDPMRTYAKIMRGDLHFPSHFTRAAIDLIRRLLHPKATKRLGAVAGGAGAVREHPWFAGFDWAAFERQEVKAPILMKVKNKEDLTNFESYPATDDRPESYVGDSKHPDWDKEF